MSSTHQDKTFDTNSAYFLTDKIKQLLNPMLAEHQCFMNSDILDVTQDILTIQVQVFRKIENGNGSIKTPEQLKWEKYCSKYKLQPEDWGKTFTSNDPKCRGTWKIWSINTRKSKYCVEVRNVQDLNEIVFFDPNELVEILGSNKIISAPLFTPAKTNFPLSIAKPKIEAKLFISGTPEFPGLPKRKCVEISDNVNKRCKQ